MPDDADVLHNRTLYSSVASCSSGVELDQAQIVVVGNARGVGGRYRIGHAVMRDALDADGIWAAIREAGLELPDRPHPATWTAGWSTCSSSARRPATAMVRGRRNAMLDDSDVHWHRQIKACVGGVTAVGHRRPGRVRVGVRRPPGAGRRRPGRRDRRPGLTDRYPAP